MIEKFLFEQSCAMDLDFLALVLKMIEEHEEFAEVGVGIKYDPEEIGSLVFEQIPDGKVLVTFKIPDGVNMPNFYAEFHKALNDGKVC